MLWCKRDSLLVKIPVKETIEYILHKTYADKLIKTFCKKSIFKKVLSVLSIIKRMRFSLNFRLIKQLDGYPRGAPMSVNFFDIYTRKMEESGEVPAKPIFYKLFVDDTYLCRKENISG